MLVRTDIPKLITAGMKKEFMRMYAEEIVPAYDKVATILVSNKKQETYPWLGSTPTMHEWKDERVPEGMLEHYFTVVNRNFEASVAVDKTAIEDENLFSLNSVNSGNLLAGYAEDNPELSPLRWESVTTR